METSLSYLCEAQVEKTDQQMVGGNPLWTTEIPDRDAQNPVTSLSHSNTPRGTQANHVSRFKKQNARRKAGVLTQSEPTALSGGLHQKEWVRPKV
jgi:hypothetical protein